jgi:dolichol kinase
MTSWRGSSLSHQGGFPVIPYNIDTLPVTIFFIGNAVLWFFYGLRQKRVYETHNFANTILTCALWVVAGVCYPFFYQDNTPSVHFFQALSNYFIIGVTPILLVTILYYQKKKVDRNPDLKEQRTVENFLRGYGIDPAGLGKKELNGNGFYCGEYSFTTDLKRKMLHLVPAVAIVGLWVFAKYIWAGIFHFDVYWQISGEDFGTFLILTVGYAGIFVFAMLEYVRFSYLFPKGNIFYLLPNNVLNLLCKAMKPKEFTEFIKPPALILAFVPAFFLPFGLFACVALGATIGDAAASMFGKKFGKTHWPRSSPKTIIGYVAGFVTTFLVSLASLWFLSDYSIGQIILLAVVNASIFFAIDIINLKVDDNILNPLFCGLGLALIALLL